MFKFDLQPVLDYRMNIEENCLIAYSEQLRSVENEKEILEALRSKRTTLMAQFMQAQSSQTTADNIAMYISYIRSMILKEQEQTAIIKREEAVLEEKREVLLEAVKSRKALDNLKDKRMQQFQLEALEKERKKLDEFGITKFQDKVNNEESDYTL